MIKQTKVSITTNDRERLYWLQYELFKMTGQKHSQEETLKWLLDLAEKTFESINMWKESSNVTIPH